MLRDFLAAFALVLVIEGILPFLSPTQWRNALLSLLRFEDRAIRRLGFVLMCVGLLLLIMVHRVLLSECNG